MAHGSPIPSFAFRTPAQRNRSLVDQMGAESERQRKMEEDEQRRLQREMQLEIQRQKLREQSEQEDLKSQFQVEQRRQQVLENQDSFLGEFGIEQRRQKSLDQQRAPQRTFTTGERTTEEERLALSAPPTPQEVETALQRGGPSIIDAPRQLVKREVIDPLVPEFRVELPARPTSLLPPGAREAVELGAQATGVDLPETTVVTSGLVEELSSYILDPINLLPVVGFGPELVRGARLAAKAGPVAVRAFAKRIAESGAADALRESRNLALKGIREAPEAGARPLRGGEEVAGVQNLAFHETSPHTAIPILQEGKFGSVGPMGVRFDVATSRELALGQRGKGAKVILDFDALTSRPIQKPGTPLVGQQEFSVTNQAGRPVLAVDFDPNALDRVTKRFIDNLRDLDPARIQDLPDGSIRVFAKDRAAAPPLRGGEAGGGTFEGLASAKDRFGRLIDPLLPQGGIPGGFKPAPRIPAGTKVKGVNLEGKAVEGELIKADQGVGLIRETGTDTVKRISLEGMEVTEEAVAKTIGDRLRQVVRDVRLGPNPRTAVPSLDPTVQKFVKALRTAKPGIRSVRAERSAELGRRTGRVRAALEAEELSAREAGIESAIALRGKQPTAPEFEVALEGGERGVLGEAFTPEEVENFVSMARLSPSLDDVPLTRKNIMDSLMGTDEKLGILLGRLPTPGELKNLEKVYGVELVEQFAKFAKFGDRAWRTLLDVLNIPRTLLASFDMSFPFRQGIFTAVRHPKEFWGNLPSMLRAAKNREFAEQMVRATKNDRTLIETVDGLRPMSELLEEAKVFQPDITGLSPLEERPEEILSQIARRIPGVTISERAFIPIGNKLRADIFKNTLQGWNRGWRARPPTNEEIADLGILVNVLTGRGNLPRSLAKNLSFGVFAPRFAVSRPQLVLAATLNAIPGVRTLARPLTSGLLGSPGATNRVAQLAATELVSSVAAGIGILTLAKMSGVAEVNLDPRSSDFGKLKIGNERIDFWGGARPWATFIARAITGKTVTATGVKFDAPFADNLLRLGRSKLSPPGALLVDVIVGETAIGEEIGGTGDILRRTIPLAIQDIFEAVLEEGLTGGIIALPAFVGVGVQTYETGSEIKKRVFEEAFPGRTYEATTEDNAIVRDAIAEGHNKAALEDAFQPSAAQMKTEEARVAEAQQLGLFTLAHAVNQLEGLGVEEVIATGSKAGPEFIDAWEDYKDRVSGAIFEATFGKDRRGTPEYLAWRDIKLQRDPTTQEPLWDEYFEAKDGAFARLDPLLRRALDRVRVPGNDPALRRTVEAYEEARTLRRESFNLPRWIGIDAERSKQITEVQRLAAARNRELAAQGEPDVPSEVIYELVGIDIGDAALARQAWFVRSGSSASKELRDPRRDQLLVNNVSILFRFFPELYREELLNITGELERVGT